MEGDKMSAGGGGLIQMILSRAIGRHLSSAAPAWPSDRYFHPLPWCCYRVVTELCAVFVHFCVILTPSALTLWRLLTPSHFHSPSEHSCYKNIAMFTLSSALLSSWPRVTWHGAKHNYAATHNTMGASVSQSEFRLETTDQWEARDPIPGIQTMMGARQTCLESWELCLDLRRNVWGVPGSLATPEHLSRPGGATRSDLYSYNHTAHREEARKTFWAGQTKKLD